MMDERGLRARALVGLTVGFGVAAYVALLWWYRGGGTLPPVSWTAALVMLVLAGLVVGAGLRIRSTRRGTASRPMDPIGVFRTLRLAQACALAGAVATGWYTALAGVTLPDVDAATMRDLGISALSAALAGVALVVAGLWVQSQCRLDPPEGGVEDFVPGTGEHR